MSDYALVIPASQGYLIGLNGILNALDFYENTCDVEVITNDIPDAYFDEARRTFDFGIHVTQLDELDAVKVEGWSGVRRLHFARYARAAQLADKYQAIMLLDADCGLVNNIMHQFQIAAQTGLILAAHNVLGTDTFTYKERHHTNAVPIANMPMFLQPFLCQGIFQRTIEISSGTGIDDMPALYYALDEAGALPDVVLLPDSLWLNNHFYSTLHQKNDKPCFGGKFYLYANRERVFVFHKRWWQEGHRAREVAQLAGEAQEIAEHNTLLWQWVYRFFNTQWKLNVDWPK